MKKGWIAAILALLVAATCVVAVVHLGNQEHISCMVIRQADRQLTVSFEDLDQGSFSGELIDGKGTVTSHTYTGVLLRELLEKKGIALAEVSGITVTSADNYSVEFTREELLQEQKIYIAITANGEQIQGIDPGTAGVQIIVFGDENSRRCVRYAQIITIP